MIRLRRHLRAGHLLGATYVARSFSGDKRQLLALIKCTHMI